MGEVLRFFEYDKVPYNGKFVSVNGKEITFSTPQLKAIRHLHTLSDGLYYDLGDNNFRFKEHVGVIQINDLTIEVLPKIDRGEQKKDKWHDILLNMLQECGFIDTQSSGYAQLRLRSNSVLELYFEKYLQELEQLIHKGLIKRYCPEEGNQYVLKGRLLFNRHLNENQCHAERFYVQYDQYDQRHLLHQVLRQALETVVSLVKHGSLADRVKSILAQWPESDPIKITEATFNRFPVSRKTQPYQESLLIARMILLNYHPDLRGGRESVLALMFNMNELWEEFIFRRLKNCERYFDWKVSGKRKLKYWTTGARGKTLIPDILVEYNNGQRIIIDTKWKRPTNQKPDDHDLRQLLAYKLYYQSDSAYLLYPCTEDKSFIVEGNYHPTSYKSVNPVFRETFGLAGGLLFMNILENNILINKRDFRTLTAELFKITS